ncbi:MAG TPA: serine/threonine-protein kinase PknK, partial [Nannocystis exedens]|nr:serine/threonine-protein kinase PknK [Nannocystis exedens]
MSLMVGGSEGLKGEGLGPVNPVSPGVCGSSEEWSPPEEFDEYRLVRLLGRGSMGQVYLAHDRVLDRPVAIKFISSLEARTTERERFVVEARAAARLHHPNIMTMYRVGELDGNPYLVCEFIRGKSLHELELPLTWQQAHKIAIGLARGLANAHRRGVLHRDIKLANVMIDEATDDVKILDFSLAKLMQDPRSSSASSSASNRRSQSLPATGAVIVDEDEFEDAEVEGQGREEEGGQADTARLEPRFSRGVCGVGEQPAEGDDRQANKARRLEVSALPAEVIAKISVLDDAWHDDTMLARLANRQRELRDDDTGPGEPMPQQQKQASDWLSEAGASPSLTRVGALMGTPHYMASELWHGEPGSRASDVYAVGVVLYALVTGRTPYSGLSWVELATAVLAGNYRPIEEVAPSVDPRFATIIERCLRTQPGERYTSGESLRSALEILTSRGRDRQLSTGNPYRGLQAFQAEHRSFFFGRSVEIRAVVERLRADPFVLVAGDSGVGKSSLCRAGALPLVLDGAIEPERAWGCVAMMPGRKPLQVLVSMLGDHLQIDEEVIQGMIRESAVAFGWYLRKRLGKRRGLVLFIDQLEELVTISDREQAATVGEVLAQISAGIPGVRLLASARGDFLTRVAEIPELGEEIARAMYLLRPLTRAGMTEAITGPAELQGVRFASEELKCELVDAGIDGSLPLLQFALAELWNVRDSASGLITHADLERIGGVTGALARHGDGVLASLLPQARREARRILVRLVTIDNTRANLSEDELTLPGGDRSVDREGFLTKVGCWLLFWIATAQA